MAAAQQLQNLQDAATCSICLTYFTDPVTLVCGHNFCRSCITRCWEGAAAKPLCPHCRSQDSSLRPNKELGLIVDLIRLNVIPNEGGLCPKHLQRLQLFCAEDHTLLCVICRESKEHKPHTVSPVEEAAQGYRATLQSHMDQLNRELQDLEQRRTKASEMEENFTNQTKRVHRTFKNLKEYLEREKQALLRRLHQEHEKTMKKIRGALTLLEKQLATHKDLVAAIEVKCEQLDAELLTDVQEILSRCSSVKGQKPKAGSKTEQNTQSPTQQDPLHEKIMEIKESFPAELEWSYVKGFEREVTLDPDTAHQSLILSADRSVRCSDREWDLPDTHERFDWEVIVLGRQRLSSERHYWEVDLGESKEWYLGLCDESASRKGEITLEPEAGYWIFSLVDGKYEAHTASGATLILCVPPRVVGLFVDCESGKFSLYNVQDRSLLFTFSGISFPRTLRPVFSPEISEGKKPVAPLKILLGSG